jgi:hypothetical protein
MKLEKLEEKFEKLFQTFTNDNFLSMKALGGEIPFYISSYNSSQESKVFDEVERVVDRLKRKGVSVYQINLFHLVIDMLKDRGILEKIIDKESLLTKEKLYKTLQGAIDTQKYLIPKIEELTSNNPSNIVFLTGIGQVYPFIRSHTVLNNLQNSIKDRPTVMFFPGIYDGTGLSLFGKLKDDNYYRAFNLETINLVK